MKSTGVEKIRRNFTGATPGAPRCTPVHPGRGSETGCHCHGVDIDSDDNEDDSDDVDEEDSDEDYVDVE